MGTFSPSPKGVGVFGATTLPHGCTLVAYLPASKVSDAFRLAAPNTRRMVVPDAAPGGYGKVVYSAADDLLAEFSVHHVGVRVPAREHHSLIPEARVDPLDESSAFLKT